jgi:hypothetical protein
VGALLRCNSHICTEDTIVTATEGSACFLAVQSCAAVERHGNGKSQNEVIVSARAVSPLHSGLQLACIVNRRCEAADDPKVERVTGSRARVRIQ